MLGTKLSDCRTDCKILGKIQISTRIQIAWKVYEIGQGDGEISLHGGIELVLGLHPDGIGRGIILIVEFELAGQCSRRSI